MMGKNRKQPFGYRMAKGRVEIDAGESTWVRYLYREYNAGATMRGLKEHMQSAGVPYEEGKKWNLNMIARILSDERYIGADGYPVIMDTEAFQIAAEKRVKKAPAVQKTEAQKILRKKCGCRVTPHMEHEVLYLLNILAGKPEQIEVPKSPQEINRKLTGLQSELSSMMELLPVDEKQVREKLLEVTVAMYEAIDPREYETYRLKRVFSREQAKSEMDPGLLNQTVSSVTIDSLGKVRVRLKNDQILERRECNE